MVIDVLQRPDQNTVQKTIRVTGVVQGVGFRPAVWCLAQELGLTGHVYNDDEGVLICCRGSEHAVDELIARVQSAPPAQSQISKIESWPSEEPLHSEGFVIEESHHNEKTTQLKTGISADLATCPDCLREMFDPANRRYRYPFINCTHCGPRLSIVRGIPYDRANTSMAVFELCPLCQREYDDPTDRRFHAQPNACPVCGPSLWITDPSGQALEGHPIAVAQAALRAGKIVAVKGVGGFHLAVDARNEQAVARLRQRKHRPHKPLALMARDLPVIKRYCFVSGQEQALLQSAAAPVVLLNVHQTPSADIAPDQQCLGMMLPPSPLHHLLLETFDTPLVMTSGNPSGQPQCISNDSALDKLANVADLFLLHNRDILNRVDDSVVQIVAQRIQMIRRGRGYAPMPLALPPGFESAPAVLALGAELKNTFCLLGQGKAVLSQHMGDLQDALTLRDFEHKLALYQQVYQHEPQCIAVDAHPQYHSSRVGRTVSQQWNRPVFAIQHHHAHMAACLGEHGWPLSFNSDEHTDDSSHKVLALTLDGLGYAQEDETLWGGEVLLGHYTQVQRLVRLKPVPLPGGNAASVQPWRNTVAHLHSAVGWGAVLQQFGELPAIQAIAQQPVDTIVAMMDTSLNAPLSSSCGRLFDAVAALLGFSTAGISFEGQAAMSLEASMNEQQWRQAKPYFFALQQEDNGLWQINPGPLWLSLLSDLQHQVPAGVMAARFHKGLARVWADCLQQLAGEYNVTHVVFTGGVFQNRHLTEEVIHLLQQSSEQQLTVLAHSQVPANDGGIALGQALITAARCLQLQQTSDKRSSPCV
ncbi:MAG: carbamoyltransferase HypF [Gammaproteobacteria bacterium]|nr:carbamoyltransferase HypF [Gammaproteobacteria bacterium]